jgi:hypothetical protein
MHMPLHAVLPDAVDRQQLQLMLRVHVQSDKTGGQAALLLA